MSKSPPASVELTTAELDYNALRDALSQVHQFGGEKKFSSLLATQVEQCNRAFLKRIAELNLSNYPTSDQILTNAVPDLLAANILQLEDFGTRNVAALQNILKDHDRQSSAVPLLHSYRWKLQRDDFCSAAALEPLLMRLSSQYEELRKRENREEKRESGVSTTVFERKSTKFWIRAPDVVKVICEIVKNLPIFSFGNVNKFSQHTTSIYYDDPKLSMYALRLVKEENSTLIRFRWYNEMTNNSVVFVERKVHHEKWVQEKSNKMRFVLPQNLILGYVQGKYTATPEFRQDHKMFIEVQQKIVKEHLEPCVQTRYCRAAFQKAGNDDSVRLSLDTNLVMVQEQGVDMKKAWRRDENSYFEEHVHRFPFAVLEVKLKFESAPPDWIEKLMNGGLLIRVDKFSKYAHGVAVLYHNRVKTLPYWLDENFSKKINEEGMGGRHPETAPDSFPATLRPKPGKSIYEDVAEQMPSQMREQPKPSQMATAVATQRSLASMCPCRKKQNKPRIETRLRIEPKTYFANERTFLQWFNASTFMGAFSLHYVLGEPGNVQAPLELLIGQLLLPVALIISVYSLIMYQYRTEKLLRREPSKTYGDRVGPTMLSAAFIALMLYSLVATQPGNYVPTNPTVAITTCKTRLCTLMEESTLPYTLWTPPRAPFKPTGLSALDDRLYVAGADGRIAVVDTATSNVDVWKQLWLAPGQPTALSGIGVDKFVYTLRPDAPAILEIDKTNHSVHRVIDLPQTNTTATGLAIVPTDDGDLAYVTTTDGAGDHIPIYFISPRNSSAVFIKSLDLPHLSNHSTSPPIVQYFPGHLLVVSQNIAYVYDLSASGQPSDTYKAFLLDIPGVRGIAFDSKQHVYGLVYDVQNDETKILAMKFDFANGFGFSS